MLRSKMKTETAILPNGNYDEIISPIQHRCYSECNLFECVEYGWKPGELLLKIEDGDPYEDGYSNEREVSYCPFCGYQSPAKKS
jgi:hypothetical protein